MENNTRERTLANAVDLAVASAERALPRLTAVSENLDARNKLALERCDKQVDWYETQSKQADFLCRFFQKPLQCSSARSRRC